MSRSGGITAVLAVVLASLVIGPPGATTAAAEPAEEPAAAGSSAQPRSVTLITGDRVSVRTVGGRTTLRVEPAPRGRPVTFQDFTQRGDRYLVPADAATLVRSGRLDVELFNVTGLVRQGYDDAHTPNVPILVRYADAAMAARAAVPAGAAVRRALPSLGMTALDQRKAEAATFWNELAKGARPTALAGGVQKVWLNAKARASLDRSVPQIGAPTAWQTGLTGRGVSVAVLDTGIDTDHPDLIGKVAQSKDFSGKGSVEDGDGHGTHVASTITGSGAASDGKYKGVAPDATLAVGKVLDDGGSGSFDAIIAGMRWAAADVRAKVVNMSLGGGPTDGTDPVSEAVNTLSRQYGTLFVVASGNYGRDETVSTPASADDALAVGSVSKEDVLSPFSSRGPRTTDGALKPEVAAPGGGIVAALPSGVRPRGEPVGEAYQRLDGTSMAAPHVAGSAAILAQQHPDWAADKLKAALVSSATEVAAGPFAVGAGRVDIARATKTSVIATGSVSTYLPWPNQGQQKRQTVTWHNSGTTPVTLDLGANLTGNDGRPAPAGLLTLAARSVTVPAGGNAPVEVTVSAQATPGTYAGVLTARTADGTVTTRTALAVRQQEEMYDLTVNLTDRNGVPFTSGFGGNVLIINLDSGAAAQGSAETYRLPRGRYSVRSFIETPRPGQEPTYSVISHPELVLDRDIEQTLDARDGQPVSAEADNPAAHGGTFVLSTYSKVRDCACTSMFYMAHVAVGGLDPRFHQAFAATVPGTSSDTFAFGLARRAIEPELELAANDGQPFAVNANWFDLSSQPAERASLSAVHGGAGTSEELAGIDLKGKLVLIQLPAGTSGDELTRRVADIRSAGGKLMMVIKDGPLEVKTLPLPTLWSPGTGTANRFAAYVKSGKATVSYVSRPLTDYRYELAYGVERQVSTPQVHRPKTEELAAVNTAYHDNAPGVVNFGASWEFFGGILAASWTGSTAAGKERVEYFTPGTWTSDWFSPFRGFLTETVELAAGRKYRIAWNKAVAGPSFHGLTVTHIGETPRPWAWRNNGAVDMRLPLYSDGAGRARPPEEGFGDTGSISLYRNGTQVGTIPSPAFADFPVTDEEASYRLVAETRRATDIWPLSTTVSAEWTFRSSAAGNGKALPLLTVRFNPHVDLGNRARGGGTFAFPAYVERQDGRPQVTSFTVEVSYDDGRSWQQATVWRERDYWKVSVRHPRTGYASLRAKATDADGNTVRQTITRAYQIGG